MSEILQIAQVEQKLLTLRGQRVLLDSDVAALYDVQTREINQAIQRNPGKFPEGYILPLTQAEKDEVITNCDNPSVKFYRGLPVAFTERGLYMLATILNHFNREGRKER